MGVGHRRRGRVRVGCNGEVWARVEPVCRRCLCGGDDFDGRLRLRCKFLILKRDVQPRAQRWGLVEALLTRCGSGHHRLLMVWLRSTRRRLRE